MQFSDGAEGRTYIRTTPFVTCLRNLLFDPTETKIRHVCVGTCANHSCVNPSV